MNTLVASALNKVLGDWLEGIDPDRLDLSIYNGTVQLGPVSIRTDALDQFGFPFVIRQGFVNKIFVNVSWTSLSKTPMRIEIEGVSLYISPRPKSQWSAEVELENAQKAKKSKLANYELTSLTPAVPDSPDFVSRTVTRAINNLQLSVSGVYLRYEDTESAANPFSVGVVLRKLEAISCNREWIPAFVAESEVNYKKVSVDCFSVFLDCGSECKPALLFGSEESDKQEFKRFSREETEQRFPFPHKFLLSPVNLTANFEINQNPRNRQIPQVVLNLVLGDRVNPLKCAFETPQATFLLKLLEFWEEFENYQRGVLNTHKFPPFEAAYARQYRERYIAYKKLIESGTRRQAEQVYPGLAEHEEQHSLDDIIMMRKAAVVEAKLAEEERQSQAKLDQLISPTKEGKLSKMKMFIGLGDNEAERQAKEEQRKREQDAIKAELDSIRERQMKMQEDLVASLPLIEGEFDAEDAAYVRFQVVIRVPEYTFVLRGSNSTLLHFLMHHYLIELSVRATLAFSFKLQLNKFVLKDELLLSAIYPNLAESGRIQLTFDKTSPDVTKIGIPMCEQLLFVANLETILVVAREFKKAVEDIRGFGKYQRAALASVDRYVALGKQYISTVVRGQERHHSFDINIDLTAPCFFIPLDIKQAGSVFTLDLGKVKVTTQLAKQTKNLQNGGHSVIPLSQYDSMRVELDQVEAATLLSFETLGKWRKGTSEVLFKPSKFVADVKVNVELKDEVYPGVVADMDVSEVAITVSDNQLGIIMKLREKIVEILNMVKAMSEEEGFDQVANVPYNAPPAPALSHHVSFRLRELSATLIQHSSAFFQVKCHQNTFIQSCTSLGNLASDLRVKSIVAEDLRSDTQWRKLCARPSSSGLEAISQESTVSKLVAETLSAQPPVRQLHENSTAEETDIDFRFFLTVVPTTSTLNCIVTLNDMRIIANHETLVALLAFPRDFLPVLSAAKPSLESIESKLMRTPRPSFLEEEKVAPEVPRDFKFTVILKRVELWAPLEPRVQSSKLLCGFLEGTAMYSSKQRPRTPDSPAEIDEVSNIDLIKLGAALGYVSDNRVQSASCDRDDLVKPFRFSLASWKRLGSDGLEISLDVVLESVETVVSVRDMVFLVDLAARFQPVFLHPSLVPEQPDNLVPRIIRNAGNRLYRGSLRCEFMQLALCDDYIPRKVTPLAKVTTSDLSAAGSFSGLELNINLSGAFAASYYNTNAGAWEPVIEFWPYDIAITPAKAVQQEQSRRRLQFKDVAVLDAVVKSDLQLHVNLSYTMIATVANVLRVLEKKRAELREDSSVQTARPAFARGGIKLKNRCGVMLEVWLEGATATEDQHHYQIEHSLKQTIPMETVEEVLGHKRGYRSLLETPTLPVRIGLQLPDMLPLRYISIGAPGRYALTNDRKDAELQGITLEIRKKPEWTVVTLESKLKVANNCPFAMTIEWDGNTIVLQPMSVVPVPCLWLVRPQSIRLQTTPGSSVPLKDTHGTVRLERETSIVVDHAWVSKFAQAGDRPCFLQHLVLLNPPMTVVNCFPARLSVTHVSTGIETMLEPGAEAALFHVNFLVENQFRWRVVMANGETATHAEILKKENAVNHYKLEGELPSDKLTVEVTASHRFNRCTSLDLPSLTLSQESFHGLLVYAFSQYWIVNHTDYHLEFTGKKGGLSVPARASGMVKCNKKSLRMRAKERADGPASDWTDSFNITSKGVAGQLTARFSVVSDKSQGRAVALFGLLLAAGTWPVTKSTIIHIYPRYMVSSDLPFPVFLKQKQGAKVLEIKKGQNYAYQFEDGTWDKHVQIGHDRVHWSSPFSIDEIESFQVRFLCQSVFNGEDWWLPSQTNAFHLYTQVTVTTENQATVFIHLSPPAEAEILIQNTAKIPVELRQEGCDHTTEVPSGQTLPFAYDNHLAAVKRVEMRIPNYCNFYNFDKIKTFKTLLGKLEIAVEPSGNTRLVPIREKLIYGYVPAVSVVVNATDRAKNFNISLVAPGVEVSFHDEEQREVILGSLSDVYLRLERRSGKLDNICYRKYTVGGSVGKVQVDNMRAAKGQFPVVFGCKDSEDRGVEERSVPFAQAQIVFDTIFNPASEHDFTRVEYVGLQLQEMAVKVHKDFVEDLIEQVWKLHTLFLPDLPANPQLSEIKLSKVCPELLPTDPEISRCLFQSAQKTFYQSVNLAAMKVVLSLKSNSSSDTPLDRSPPNDFLSFLCRFSSALMDITDSSLSFNAIIVLNSFQTFGSMMKVIRQRYWSQGLLQFYRLLGSADLIGNPLGLIDKLGTGVFEFFSQPIKGLMKSPEDFAQGVSRGVKSLISNAVSGSANSVSKITGSLYTFMRKVGGDSASVQPSETVAEGVIEGVKGGIEDFALGVVGILAKPLRGAETGGVTGFIKGVGTGVVGAVVAPLTMVLRVGTSVVSSVATQATPTVGCSRTLGRMRYARQVGAMRVLEPYHRGVAEAQALLRSLPGGLNGNLTFFTEVSQAAVVLLTEKDLILMHSGEVSQSLPLHKLDRVELRESRNGFLIFLVSDHSPLRIRSDSFPLLAKLYRALEAFKGRTINSSLV